MPKTLLINPSYKNSYGSAKGAIVDPIFPTLSLLTIAAMAERHGHQVEIFDMSYMQYDYHVVKDKILESKPDVIGISATTPLMNQLRDMTTLIKAISKNILVVGGGSHVSAMPTESLHESMLDIVVVGEGDYTFADIMNGISLKDIKGIFYRKDGVIHKTIPRHFVANLDDLPMPAWHLHDSRLYKNKISRLLARCPPLAMAEFSRGCVFKCDFCASKNTMALGYRKKSPERCAEEVRLMHKFGYREFALADDIFTSDNAWAKQVAECILKIGIKMAWTCTNGIRVESADKDLFKVMRKAGCYRVSFGFESGNDRVLKAFGKGGLASIEKGREAVKNARKADIDANGYFMLGLSPDTKESMNDTIEYARSLSLDMMKFGIAIAFPGTLMFKEYREKGFIRSYNWDDYFIYSSQPLFSHPNLTFDDVQAYVRKSYWRAVVTNPAFIIRRLWRGIRTLEFFWDVYYFFKFMLGDAVNSQTSFARYYAKELWPKYDFENEPIIFYPMRSMVVKKSAKEEFTGIVI